MRKPTRRGLIYGGIAAVITVVVILAMLPDPLAVDVAPAARVPMQVTVDERGQTRSIDRYVVTAPVAGELRRIDFREGAAVERGDVVAVLDPVPLDVRQSGQTEARVAAATSAVAEARAMESRASSAASQAESDLRRIAALAEQGIASEEQLERARSAERTSRDELAAARSRVRASQAELDAARAATIGGNSSGSTESVEVDAPVSGRVLSIADRSGRLVQQGERLMELSAPGQIELVIEMLSTEAVKVDPGDPVIIEEWGGNEPLRGTVRLVEPSGFTKISALGIEEQRVNVIADLVSPPAQLGDGYRVEASVVIWREENVLQVPISTLFRQQEEWALFVVEGERAVVRTVEVGRQNDRTAQILSGIEEGELVVLHPSLELTAGARVTPRE